MNISHHRRSSTPAGYETCNSHSRLKRNETPITNLLLHLLRPRPIVLFLLLRSGHLWNSRPALRIPPLEVIGERLGLVDGLLLPLRVVRVDLSRRRVAGCFAAAEALAGTFMNISHHRRSPTPAGYETCNSHSRLKRNETPITNLLLHLLRPRPIVLFLLRSGHLWNSRP